MIPIITLEPALAFGWTAYHGVFSVQPDREFIVYVRLTDQAGNVAFLSSDGVVLDAAPPVIAGIEDGKTYAQAKDVTVTDMYLDTFTLNGKEQTVTENRCNFTLTGNGTYTVTAKDKAGNETVCTVTIAIPAPAYVLTFDTDGGTPVPETQTLPADAIPKPVSDPVKDGYTFHGWFNGETKVTLRTFTMPEKNVILTAHWEESPNNPGVVTKPANPSIPQTGDLMPVWPFWAGLASLCVLGLTLVTRKRRMKCK